MNNLLSSRQYILLHASHTFVVLDSLFAGLCNNILDRYDVA